MNPQPEARWNKIRLLNSIQVNLQLLGIEQIRGNSMSEWSSDMAIAKSTILRVI